MDLFAATAALNRFTASDTLHEIKPLAVLHGMRDAVDAGRPQGADRITLAQTEAVDELFDGRLMGAVMAERPGGMRLVQRAVRQDLLVNGAGRNEDESAHFCRTSGLDQLQRAEDV